MALLTRAKSNEDVLRDVTISKKDKEKIKKIRVYKNYFYDFWNKRETSIYSKTTILHDEAVTYLVIVSPFDKIEAKKECFPVMGCFPYLGFFKKSSAKDYAQDMKKKGYVTYTRPVYAYSTLGYFTDTILSSFFIFDDFELAELIFHELFHTIFFIKNEVELNENLANYFGKEMALKYFMKDETLRSKLEKERLLSRKLSEHTVKIAREIQSALLEKKPIMKNEATKILAEYIEQKLIPGHKEICLNQNVPDEKCYILKRKWNQASLAALMTYENKVDQLKLLRGRISGDLKGFFHYIELELKNYKSSGSKEPFSKWLFKNE